MVSDLSPYIQTDVMVQPTELPGQKICEGISPLGYLQKVNLLPVAQRTNAFHKWRRRPTMGR